MKTLDGNGRDKEEDLEQFLQGEEEVPSALRDRVVKTIKRRLEPNIGITALKLALIHLAVSALSLEACSQFGLGKGQVLGHASKDLEGFLCTAFCGAVFLGFSMLAGGLIISRQEHQQLRAFVFFPVIVLSILSLGALLAFGASMRLDEAFTWFLGASVAGILGLICAFQISVRCKAFAR